VHLIVGLWRHGPERAPKARNASQAYACGGQYQKRCQWQAGLFGLEVQVVGKFRNRPSFADKQHAKSQQNQLANDEHDALQGPLRQA